jgi:molybdopterin/thiamine biosynthesis adenylyltransferase
MMALEAVKYLTGAGEGLAGSLLIYDGLWGESRKLTTQRRADCMVCGAIAGLQDAEDLPV